MGNVVDSLFSFSCLERTPYHLLESCFLALFFCSSHTPFLTLSYHCHGLWLHLQQWPPAVGVVWSWCVLFSCNQKVVSEQNFQEKLDKIQKVIYIWNMRGLSLFGRVTVVKTFLIPKLLYVSSIIQTPMEIIKRMERMIFNFFMERTRQGHTKFCYKLSSKWWVRPHGYSNPN